MTARAALYARVSSDRQAKQQTIQSQITELRGRVQADGALLLPSDEYVDDGVSGTSLLRPGLEKLRDRVSDGAIDRIYVHAPDRLARKYAYQVLLLEEFERAGVSVWFVHGASGDDSPEASLLKGVQGVIAEYERARILERTRRGRIHKARSGQASALGKAPFGYRFVRRPGGGADYVVHEQEAEVVVQLFKWLGEDGLCLEKMAKRLIDNKVPTAKGGRWTGSALHRIVNNTTYKGEAHFGKTMAAPPGAVSRKIRPSLGRVPARYSPQRMARPDADHIIIPVPPIVTHEIFAAANVQLARNSALASRGAKPRTYLLQGLVRCGLCNHAFVGKCSGLVPYYRCNGRTEQRAAKLPFCGAPGVRGDDLDAYVWAAVSRVLAEPTRVAAEWTERNEADGTQALLRERRDAAARALRAAEVSLSRLLDAYEAGHLSLAELGSRSDRARARVTTATDALNDAEATMRRSVELTALVSTVEAFASRLRAGMGAASWADRQKVIRALVREVVVDGANVHIVYQIPTSCPARGDPNGEPGPGSPSGGSGDGSRIAHLSSLRRAVAAATA